MNCENVMEKIYENYGEEPQDISLLTQIRIWLHLFFCPDCARENERFMACRNILNNDFLPPAQGLEDSVMAMITTQGGLVEETASEETPQTALPTAPAPLLPGFLSTRGWVIAGLIMFVSLATAFFGLEFNKIALAAGMSFLLPVGIIIGIFLTVYGALFIGSHLKELTERFGL